MTEEERERKTEEERKRRFEAWQELKRHVREDEKLIAEMRAIILRQQKLARDQRLVMCEQMELIKRIFKLMYQGPALIDYEAWEKELDSWLDEVQENYQLEIPAMDTKIQ